MSDLSKLSDADLEAIASGDMSKVSDAGLKAIAGAPEPAQRSETPTDLMRERGGFAPAQSPVARSASNQALASVARYGPGVVPGGPAGGIATAGGEKVAQLIEGGNDDRAVMQAGAMGSIPFGKVAEAGPVLGKVLTPIVAGGANYITNRIADAVLGENKDGPSNVRQAATVAGITAAMPWIGKAIGKFAGEVPIPDNPTHAFERENLREGQKLGLKVSPSSIKDDTHPVMKMMAGTQGLNQAASAANTGPIQSIARSSIGLKAEPLPFRPGELEIVREEQYAPYNKIREIATQAKDQLAKLEAQWLGKGDGLSASEAARRAELEADPGFQRMAKPLRIQAAADIDGLKAARAEAFKQRKLLDASDGKNPDAAKALQEANGRIADLETKIKDAANLSNDPALVEKLDAARARIARTYDLEAAINPGNGFVDAAYLGRKYKDGVPFDGDLEKLAKFANVAPRDVVEFSRVGDPNAQALTGVVSGTGAVASGNPSGLLALGIPGVRNYARNKLLSDSIQRETLNPKTSRQIDPRLQEIITRLSAIQAARP